jgi:fructose-1,6-bisphosphatase/inositol monophosphatase family enzyme
LEVKRENATIALYGYKMRRFASVGAQLATCVADSDTGGRNQNIFVSGGNPALVRTIDGFARIDAVIEPFGQAVHDMIAGAYICKQGGGTVLDLDEGQALNLEGLISLGLCARVSYVAAATPLLASSLQREFAGFKENARSRPPAATGSNK